MPSADFCTAVSAPCGPLSPDFETRCRSPAISSTAVRTRPPDLRSASLMDVGFVVCCRLVRRSRLLSGSCPSARTFAPRFLQTPRRRGALAVRYPSPPSGWERTLTSKLSNMRGVQQKPRARVSRGAHGHRSPRFRPTNPLDATPTLVLRWAPPTSGRNLRTGGRLPGDSPIGR